MGYGVYSSVSRADRAETLNYATKAVHEIFTQQEVHHEMKSVGVSIRESRDSAEHPNVVPILIALDVTGSMGSIPHFLVKEGLPNMVTKIFNAGIKDPQIMFCAVGDHECDTSPLQVGQFESSDELMDKWLTSVYLEGGGGGNDGESYLLAWYFAANHTDIDSFNKRGQKGFLFTIGDEPTLEDVPARALSKIMGGGQYKNELTAVELLEKAREKYNVFHLHIAETYAGSQRSTVDGWKQLMRDNLIVVKDKKDVAQIIADTVIKYTSNVAINERATENAQEGDEQVDNGSAGPKYH